MVVIGAEYIFSPLGDSVKENFDNLLASKTGVSRNVNGFHSSQFNSSYTFLELLEKGAEHIKQSLGSDFLNQADVKVIISTTKGDVSTIKPNSIADDVQGFSRNNKLINNPLIVSNACISGVQAIAVAQRLIIQKKYKHVVVIGADVVSEFVLEGFQSLHALSESFCKPYDANRDGINIGEACGVVVLSNDPSIFKQGEYCTVLGGSVSNDANHISGPSRTGEGLYRSVLKTLEQAELCFDEVDHVSAHGTATIYNDEMESIAFNRLGIENQTVNSLKGYFGHTLGAAGVIETAVALQELKQQIVLKTLGYSAEGTSQPIRVTTENTAVNYKTVLKTASGFGGGNASILLQAI